MNGHMTGGDTRKRGERGEKGETGGDGEIKGQKGGDELLVKYIPLLGG